MTTRAIHSNIRVIDDQKSIEFYTRALGLEVADRLDFDDFSLIFLSNPMCTFELELTVNHGRTEAYTHGTGYGHFAISVDDIHAEHARHAEMGLEPTPVKELHTGGTCAVRFYFLTDPDGYKVEIVHRQGRYL